MSVLLCAIETEKPEEITGGSHFSSDFPESSVQIPSPCLPYELKWRLTYSRLQSCFGMMKYRYTLEVFWGFFWKKTKCSLRQKEGVRLVGRPPPKNRAHTPRRFRRKLWGAGQWGSARLTPRLQRRPWLLVRQSPLTASLAFAFSLPHISPWLFEQPQLQTSSQRRRLSTEVSYIVIPASASGVFLTLLALYLDLPL